jgi:hypothetical protein
MHYTIPRLRVSGLPRPGDARRKATEALAVATRNEAALQALGRLMAARAGEQPDTSYTDPKAARIQARRKRIAESGLTLIQGSAAQRPRRGDGAPRRGLRSSTY